MKKKKAYRGNIVTNDVAALEAFREKCVQHQRATNVEVTLARENGFHAVPSIKGLFPQRLLGFTPSLLKRVGLGTIEAAFYEALTAAKDFPSMRLIVIPLADDDNWELLEIHISDDRRFAIAAEVKPLRDAA